MLDAGEDPAVREPTHRLITWGPFGVTRNPIYVSVILLYARIALVYEHDLVSDPVPTDCAGALLWLY